MLDQVTETSGSSTAQRPRPLPGVGITLMGHLDSLWYPRGLCFSFPEIQPLSSLILKVVICSRLCASLVFRGSSAHSRVPAWYCKTMLRIQTSLQSAFPWEALVSLASGICSLLNIRTYPFPTCFPGPFSFFSLPLSLNLAGS